MIINKLMKEQEISKKESKRIYHNYIYNKITDIKSKRHLDKISCNRLESRDGKQFPIFFHNGSGYDFHFITEELLKHEREYKKVKVLPKDTEKYISITYGDQ